MLMQNVLMELHLPFTSIKELRQTNFFYFYKVVATVKVKLRHKWFNNAIKGVRLCLEVQIYGLMRLKVKVICPQIQLKVLLQIGLNSYLLIAMVPCIKDIEQNLLNIKILHYISKALKLSKRNSLGYKKTIIFQARVKLFGQVVQLELLEHICGPGF